MQKIGITNLKPVIAFGIELGNVADKMGRAKGSIRYLPLFELFDELTALGSVDFSQVRKEIEDLDSSERSELNSFLKSNFDIVDDRLEGVIEDSLEVIEQAYALVKRSIELVKKARQL